MYLMIRFKFHLILTSNLNAMNANQEDKLSMYYVVRDTAERYRPTWVSNAVFAATYNLWAEKIPQNGRKDPFLDKKEFFSGKGE